MTDRYRVYTKVKKTLKDLLKPGHQGQVVTLAMMITGIVLSRKAQLSEMNSEIPTETKGKSVEMRMRRWVKNELDVEAVYLPFARQILEALRHLPLVLVMDGSQAGRGCMVLMVGVLYTSQASIADRLAGVQGQERACERGATHSSIGKGVPASAGRQSSDFVGRR